MSLKKEILSFAEKNAPFTIRLLREKSLSRYSRVYLSRQVSQLVKKGLLVKYGSTAGAEYALKKDIQFLKNHIHKRVKNEDLDDFRLYEEIREQLPFITTLEEHLQSILVYAFTEMLNNAIEHSRSPQIEISFRKEDERIFFIIQDFGVGVFKKCYEKAETGVRT